MQIPQPNRSCFGWGRLGPPLRGEHYGAQLTHLTMFPSWLLFQASSAGSWILPEP